jgi:hypothetical protein
MLIPATAQRNSSQSAVHRKTDQFQKSWRTVGTSKNLQETGQISALKFYHGTVHRNSEPLLSNKQAGAEKSMNGALLSRSIGHPSFCNIEWP